MKMRAATVVLFASMAYALDVGSLLQQAGPLLKKAKCAMPCLGKAASSIQCDGSGPIGSLCDNLDQITSKAAPCIKKCGIEKHYKDAGFKFAQAACNQLTTGISKRQEDAVSCSSCPQYCSDSGCEDDDDCEYCESLCDLFCTETGEPEEPEEPEEPGEK